MRLELGPSTRRPLSTDFFDREKQWVLCREGLCRCVDVPEGVRYIDVVVTNKDTADNFKMTGRFGGGDGGVLVGVDTYLLNPLRAFLREAYKAGYRYVHIEYTED